KPWRLLPPFPLRWASVGQDGPQNAHNDAAHAAPARGRGRRSARRAALARPRSCGDLGMLFHRGAPSSCRAASKFREKIICDVHHIASGALSHPPAAATEYTVFKEINWRNGAAAPPGPCAFEVRAPVRGGVGRRRRPEAAGGDATSTCSARWNFWSICCITEGPTIACWPATG